MQRLIRKSLICSSLIVLSFVSSCLSETASSSFAPISMSEPSSGLAEGDATPTAFALPGPPPIASAESTEPKLSVAIMFLVDMSGSVIGRADENSDQCPTGSQPIHKKTLEYLINVLTALPDNNMQQIAIGVGKFGETYETILPFMSIDEIDSSGSYPRLETFLEQDPVNENSTHYASAISNGNNILQAYARNDRVHKIIILLTDGFGVDGLGVEDALENVPFDTQIYMAPVCPNYGDITFWKKHRIPALGNSPDEWLKNIFNLPAVKAILPVHSGWINGKTSEEAEIDGKANHVTFEYRPFALGPDAAQVTARVIEDATNEVSLSNGLADFQPKPRKLCALHKYAVETTSPSDRGFWWVSSFTKPTISLQMVLGASGTNDIPISISSIVSAGQDLTEEFGNWGYCFDSLGLSVQDPTGKVLDWSGLEEQKCDGASDLHLCPDKSNGTLTKTWSWVSPHFDKPILVNAASVYRDDDAEDLVTSNEMIIPIYFQPQIVDVRYELKPKKFSDDPNKVHFAFLTEFDVDLPNLLTMYLIRSNGVSASQNRCPVTDSNWNGHPAYTVPRNTPNDMLNARISTSHIHDEGVYELEMSKTALYDCGFDEAVFSWKANNTARSLASDWICNLAEGKCDPVQGASQ